LGKQKEKKRRLAMRNILVILLVIVALLVSVQSFWAGAVGGPQFGMVEGQGGQPSQFEVEFEAGEIAAVSIRPVVNHTFPIQVTVTDPDGKVVLSRKCSSTAQGSGMRIVAWNASKRGKYKIKTDTGVINFATN
jgi:hypothetical protein